MSGSDDSSVVSSAAALHGTLKGAHDDSKRKREAFEVTRAGLKTGAGFNFCYSDHVGCITGEAESRALSASSTLGCFETARSGMIIIASATVHISPEDMRNSCGAKRMAQIHIISVAMPATLGSTRRGCERAPRPAQRLQTARAKGNAATMSTK